MSYLASNIGDLYEQAPPEIQTLIHGGEVNTATSILGKLYKLPVSQYVALSNLISYLLMGAILPENAVEAIKDMLKLSDEDALRLAEDLDKTILEKARIKILGKPSSEMVTLTFQDGRSPDELRKEILDTTKRGAVYEAEKQAQKAQGGPAPEKDKTSTIVPGSRTALLEQLQLIGNIPNDDEVTERLEKIKEQIANTVQTTGRELDSNVPLQSFLPKEDSPDAVLPSEKPATYSKAPTKYNVDPYREITEE